jgi:hypothetical protein
MDEAGIEAMLKNARDDVAKVLGPDGENKVRSDTKQYYPRHARLGDRILKNYVQFLKVY